MRKPFSAFESDTPLESLERPEGDGWKQPEPMPVDLARATLTTAFLERAFEFFLPALLMQYNWDSGEVYLRTSSDGELARVFACGAPLPILSGDQSPSNSMSGVALKQNSVALQKGDPSLNAVLGCGLWLGLRSGEQLHGALVLGRMDVRAISEEERERMQGLADWLGALVTHERERGKAERESVRGERERIGMDLHDGIIQSLYGIGLALQNARMHSIGNSELEEAFDRALGGLDKAVGDIRNYILNLRPRELSGKCLLDGMRSLTREFRANTFIDVELEGSESESKRLPRAQSEALFHIYQEALSNVAKHAHASKVMVKVWRMDERMMLRVSDDGSGIDPAQSGKRMGHGVANMQTRAEAVGGGIELTSIRKQGTTLRAWVPLKSTDKPEEEKLA